MLALLAIAALHPLRIYAGLAAFFALGGAAAAGRQVWLQHLPPDKVPQCGPDLFFMLENFPLSRTLKTLVAGTGECAVVDWTFLGLSIAEWSLLWFAGARGCSALAGDARPPATPSLKKVSPGAGEFCLHAGAESRGGDLAGKRER